MLVILLPASVLQVSPVQAARGGDACLVAVVLRPSTPGSPISISKPLAPSHPWEYCLYDRLGAWTGGRCRGAEGLRWASVPLDVEFQTCHFQAL